MFVSNQRRRIEMEENMKKIKYLIITLSVISLILIYFYNKKVPTFIKVRTIQIIYNYLHVIIYLRYLLFLEKVD